MKERLAKMLARCGMPILMRPPESDKYGFEDCLMILHYCGKCRRTRYDKLVDFFSKNEHFLCGGCGRYQATGLVFGLTFFVLIESIRLKIWHKVSWLRFWWNTTKYLPDNRNGKTAGELEMEALSKLFSNIHLTTR